MKKKLLITGGVILAVVLFCTLVMPHVILKMNTQDPADKSIAYGDVFFDEYEEVRAHFLEKTEELKAAGMETQSESYEISAEEGLYIDSLYVPAKEEQTNLIVITTGVHGIEGYIGSVMLDVFWEEVYPTVNPENNPEKTPTELADMKTVLTIEARTYVVNYLYDCFMRW